VQAIDQMKPTISRAMATLTTLAVLPHRRYRVQSRTCAFRPTPVLAAVTQQKISKMLTRSRRDLPDDAAQPDQVTHGFMNAVRITLPIKIAKFMQPQILASPQGI
jgi:hypothetical protein